MNGLVIAANREPYLHVRARGGIAVQHPASGVTAALDPVLRSTGGVWVAHGSGDADWDVVDSRDHVRVPPEDPRYTLRRIRLTQAEEDGYYFGFANGALWPLCHVAYTRPVFDRAQWEAYVSVNRRFAEALDEEAPRDGIVFIQDYHFALVPRFLRDRRPDLAIGQFWHIPWPNPEVFRICPWKEEILRGLLANDVLGFHIQYHCNNFLYTVDRELEARLDREQFAVFQRGHRTLVRPFPIGVDAPHLEKQAASAEVGREMERWRERLEIGSQRVSVGVDRIDYTKGLLERLEGIDRFLRRHPAWRRKFVHVQVAVPSRTRVPAYRQLHDELVDRVAELNRRHGPVVRLVAENVPQIGVQALYRLADLCLVSSLHDGMNLVAKEFVATRVDERGVLLLSPFTGAARELVDAVQVNPYAVDDLADALGQALEMTAAEQQRRMRRMRRVVREHDIHRWARRILRAIARSRE